MALVLHIADLHLVASSVSPPLGDHKAGLVSAKDRVTHQGALTLTLARLGEEIVNQGKTLDAIVMTGDISDKNNEGGYIAFIELLNALGSAKPPNRCILVLPGNHDVTAGLRPGDANRYEKFVKYIRGAGFVTPWIAELDNLPTTKSEAEKYLVSLEDIQIVPIDTSGYSQVRLDIPISDASWANLEGVLAGNPQERAALQRLRIVDAARISEVQLEAVRTIANLARESGAEPLRIAAIHHHLLPVSTKEEVKPFESITNLGLVRQFLRDQEYAVVLHGHKHTEFTYLDYISSFVESPGLPSPVRVISGASSTAIDLDRTDVFRLLDIQANAGFLQLRRISAVVPGMKVLLGKPELLNFARPGRAQAVRTAKCFVIEGESVDDVYHQLVAAVANDGRETEHVLCHIGASPNVARLAALYPGLVQVPGIAEDQEEIATAKRLEQFEDIVQWWQYTSIPRGPLDHPAFTHGDRIRRYEGHLDQIASIIDALAGDAKTSRGIAVLLNPPADRISDPDVQFPSFCLVQFKIQKKEGESPSLDCTAYFRKQEVRYWWLVNLAELAKLQREICDALAQRANAPEIRGIRPGGITTIAARAHAGDGAPKVQIPLIDRSYSLERERLFGMVNSLVWDSMPNREDYAGEWLQMFFELHPPEKSDPDGVAVAQAGIEYLKNEIGKHLKATSAGDVSLAELHRALEQLLNANRDFALAQRKQEATSEKYKAWRGTVKPLIERVIELSYGRITALKLNNM